MQDFKEATEKVLKIDHTHAGIGRRTYENDRHWIDVNPKDIKIDKPTLLLLGGDMASGPEQANGMVKVFEGLGFNIPDILSVYYKNIEPGSTGFQRMNFFNSINMLKPSFKTIYAQQMAENSNPQYVHEIFDAVIAPMISPDREQTAKNLGNLNIITYSHGSYVAAMLERAALQKMSEMGYSDDEKNATIKHLTVVAVAPTIPVGYAKSDWTSMASLDDDFFVAQMSPDSINRKLDDQEYGRVDAQVRKISDNENLLIVNSLFQVDPLKNSNNQSEHNIKNFIARDVPNRIAGSFFNENLMKKLQERGITPLRNNNIRTELTY